MADTADRRLVELVRRDLAAMVPFPPEEELTALARRAVAAAAPLLDPVHAARIAADVVASVRGLGPLDALLADDRVSDVLVNGDGSVWTEREGRLGREPVDVPVELRAAIVERIVNPLGLRVDRARPIVDARLPDGTRVHVVVPPIAVDGPCLSLRRFGAVAVGLEAFCDDTVAAALRAAVRAGCNLLVSGGTGAGKTTLLNALATAIPSTERIITVEDAAELRLRQRDVVRLEARPPNAEGVGEVTIRDLVRTSLRMRPDRIVVGEVRGPEALDMLQAMNTGHEGSMSTCHANGPTDALRRLETMVLTAGLALPSRVAREHITAAIDVVVQVERAEAGRRRISAVHEVVAPSEGVDGPTLGTHPLVDHTGRVVGEPRRTSRRDPGRPWWSP